MAELKIYWDKVGGQNREYGRPHTSIALSSPLKAMVSVHQTLAPFPWSFDMKVQPGLVPCVLRT